MDPASLPTQFTSEHAGAVLNLIEQCASHQPGISQQAMKLFEQCQRRPGMAALCLQLATDPSRNSVSDAARAFAMLTVKSAATRQWIARGSQSSISDEEKVIIRSLLLQRYVQTERRIFLTMAHAIAKIARTDWPNTWPELFPTLLDGLRNAVKAVDETIARQNANRTATTAASSNPLQEIQGGSFMDLSCSGTDAYLHLLRTLQVFHYVIKELSTRTLSSHRKAFTSIAENVVPMIMQLLERNLNAVIPVLTMGEAADALQSSVIAAPIFSTLQLIKIQSKILFRLVRNGSAELIQGSTVNLFWKCVMSGTHAFLITRERFKLRTDLSKPADSIVELLENIVSRWTLTVVDVQKRHPLEFRSVLGQFLSFFMALLPVAFAQTQVTPAVEAADINGSGDSTVTLLQQSWLTHLKQQHTGNETFRPCYPPLGSAPLLSQLAISLLRFFTHVLDESMYRAANKSSNSFDASHFISPDASQRVMTSSGDQYVTQQARLEANAISDRFFTSDRVSTLIQFLITVALPLTRDDLESWETDGENFEIARQQETVEAFPRPAAEGLLVTLIETDYTKVPASNALLAILTDIESAAASATTEGPSRDALWTVLDAAYLAAGVCAFQLQPMIPFRDWFTNRLAPTLQLAIQAAQSLSNNTTTPLTLFQRVVLRRTLWLVVCWRADLNSEGRQFMYNTCAAALQIPDPALMLVASDVALQLVEDWDFEESEVQNYVESFVQGSYKALFLAQTLDGKLHFAHLVQALTDRLHRHTLLAHSQTLLRPMSELWETCQDYNPVKKHFVSILTALCRAAGDQSHEIHSSLIPFVSRSVDTESELKEHVYLMEDGLLLWQSIIETSHGYTSAIHDLFPRLPRVLSNNSVEHAKSIGEIISAYVIVGYQPETGGNVFLEHNQQTFAAIFNALIGQTNWKATKTLCKGLEEVIMSSSHSLFQQIFPLISDALARAFAGAIYNMEPLVSQLAYLSVWARLVLERPENAVQLLAQIEQIFMQSIATSGGTQQTNSMFQQAAQLPGYESTVNVNPNSAGSGAGCQTVIDCIRGMPLYAKEGQRPSGYTLARGINRSSFSPEELPSLAGNGIQALTMLLDNLIEYWDSIAETGSVLHSYGSKRLCWCLGALRAFSIGAELGARGTAIQGRDAIESTGATLLLSRMDALINMFAELLSQDDFVSEDITNPSSSPVNATTGDHHSRAGSATENFGTDASDVGSSVMRAYATMKATGRADAEQSAEQQDGVSQYFVRQRTKLYSQDVHWSKDVRAYIKESFQAARSAFGEARFDHVLSAIDTPSVQRVFRNGT